jgi:polyhydroxybutyrate depolymerase
MSAGCGSAPPATDVSSKYIKHDIMVTNVDPAFLAAHPATGGGSWTNRTYYLNLPANYDQTKAYPVLFGGGGCGGGVVTNGDDGGFPVLPGNTPLAIQIGLSYVWPQGAGACFADGFSDTPDLPYFDAILAEVEANYCVDKSKLFVAGYSSGAWESYMLGFARGGTVLRGIATAAGGLRLAADRPPASGKPFAALLLTGGSDTENPLTGPTGSALARDLVLQTNGCVGTATTPWPTYAGGACLQYTGCPAAYPVIFCNGGPPGHTDGGAAYKPAIWTFWSTLMAP